VETVLSHQTGKGDANERWDWTTCLTMGSSIVLVITIVWTFSPQQGYGDRGFDAATWRDEPRQRAAMTDDLIERLEDRAFTRDELLAILGEPSNQRASKVTWTIGECGWGMPTYCYLNVDFTADGRVDEVYETRD
jgi:hypothetical protein